MNYTLESFIDFCDTREIAEEGFFFKKKNKSKPPSMKPKETSPKADLKEIESTYESIKKGIVSDYDCLKSVIKTKNISKKEFDLIARKIYKKDGKDYIKDCLMNSSGDVIPEAEKTAKDLMLTVVDTDGVGGYLLYSIKKGMFYNFYTDEDTGETIDKWTSEGTQYENILK